MLGLVRGAATSMMVAGPIKAEVALPERDTCEPQAVLAHFVSLYWRIAAERSECSPCEPQQKDPQEDSSANLSAERSGTTERFSGAVLKESPVEANK